MSELWRLAAYYAACEVVFNINDEVVRVGLVWDLCFRQRMLHLKIAYLGERRNNIPSLSGKAAN